MPWNRKGEQRKDAKAKGKKRKKYQGVKYKNKDGRKVTKKKPSIIESPQKERTTCIVCLEDYDED